MEYLSFRALPLLRINRDFVGISWSLEERGVEINKSVVFCVADQSNKHIGLFW